MTVLLLLAGGILSAQTGRLTVQVTNESQEALENITLELVRSRDSVLVKAGISDRNGMVELERLRPGDYLVRASGVNFNTRYSAPFFHYRATT